MDKQSQRFLGTWLLACIALATVSATFNLIVDPHLIFGMPRIVGFNARKPTVLTRERLMKAYDVLHAAPKTVVLGTSMVDWGLDAMHPAWPANARPVYNLALQGSGPYTSYRYLQHVMSRNHPALVMLGLDFEFFLTVPDYQPVTPEFESRLAVTREGRVNAGQSGQYIHDVLRATLSLDALTDSVATLAANFDEESVDLTAGNFDMRMLFRQYAAEGGSYAYFTERDTEIIRRYPGKQRNPLVMGDVQSILDLCESHGTRVILFINPAHADYLEILDLLGHWHAFEEWKRDLVALTAQYPGTDGRAHIQLWDFSGYNSYSTESVPVGRHVVHWFWDSTHYTRALGNAIVNRIFGSGDTHFGALVTPQSIEPHLIAIREQQRLYRKHHQLDVRRVQDLYDSVAGNP